MRTLLSLLVILLSPGIARMLPAQVNAFNAIEHAGAKYDAFTVIADSLTVPNFKILTNNQMLEHKEYLKTYWQDSAIFLINASIVDSFCNPIGWFMDHGTEIQPINNDDGIGNFYLKPNGAFLITDDIAHVIETDSIQEIEGVRFGIQSGPLLVNNGIVNPHIRQGSANKFIRCGVGITTMNGHPELVFAISLEPVNFWDFSQFFTKSFQCTTVLCLESAGSVFKFPFMDNFTSDRDIVVCRYIAYILR